MRLYFWVLRKRRLQRIFLFWFIFLIFLLFRWSWVLWYLDRGLIFLASLVFFRFVIAILRRCWVDFRFRFLSNFRITNFILSVNFFEVEFVELIVFVENFADVGLTNLLEVQVEHLAIETSYEGIEDVFCRLKLFFIWRRELRMILSLQW